MKMKNAKYKRNKKIELSTIPKAIKEKEENSSENI